jgi:Acyltransferase family
MGHVGLLRDSVPSDGNRFRSEHGMGQFVSIQYLRGFAAMLVLGYHAAEGQLDVAAHGSHPFAVDASGVDIFFVISGFIMLAAKEKGLAMRPAGYKLDPVLVGPEINSPHIAFGDVPSRDGLDAALLVFADRVTRLSRCPRSVDM